MAIKIGGTTVIDDNRNLVNIASGAGPADTLTAWNEILFMNTADRRYDKNVYYKGGNATPSDSTLMSTGLNFGDLSWSGFAIKSLGAPNSYSWSPNVTWGQPITNLWTGGTNIAYPNMPGYGSYAANFNAGTTSLQVDYNYTAGPFNVNAFYMDSFSSGYEFDKITLYAYVNSAWTEMDSFTDNTNADQWRLFDTFNASSLRWKAEGASINFVFRQMQFAGVNTAAASKYVDTPNKSLGSSIGNSCTAYAVVKGTNSGWTFGVSRNGGANYQSPATSTVTQYGEYYVYKLTYNLIFQGSGTTLGMRVTFPNDASAEFHGCKIEGS